MKVIIAGCRYITDFDIFLDAIEASGFIDENSEIVSGMADGVDTLAVMFAKETGLKLHEFPADWEKFKKAAGPVRNRKMAEFADALIAVWDGKSPGTKDMISNAKRLGLKVYVHMTEKQEFKFPNKPINLIDEWSTHCI